MMNSFKSLLLILVAPIVYFYLVGSVLIPTLDFRLIDRYQNLIVLFPALVLLGLITFRKLTHANMYACLFILALSVLFTPGYFVAQRGQDLSDCRQQIKAVAIEVELVRVNTGAYPQELESHFASVPVCPRSKHPYLYETYGTSECKIECNGVHTGYQVKIGKRQPLDLKYDSARGQLHEVLPVR